MAEWAKLDVLSSIPTAHTVEGENQLPKLSSDGYTNAMALLPMPIPTP